MKQFNHLLNRDYHKLRWIINHISYRLGIKLGRNPSFDERGLTDELLDQLQEMFDHLKFIKYYINLNVHKPSEKSTGADMLLRVIVNKAEISFDRYVLIQAKKYIASKGLFGETDAGNKHLSSQVAKMHAYNPEFSYILLYSTEEEPTGNIVINSYPSETLSWQLLPYIDELFGDSKLMASASIKGNYPVTFLRSKTWEKFRNNKPEDILPYSETFASFLLDDVITGKLGKEWHPEIQSAQGNFSFVITISISQG
ncbi:hypothetical protein GCM10028818_59130 [Spirosoma horti]